MTQEIDPLVVLKGFVAEYETQVQAAAALDVTPQYLSDLLSGRRDCSDVILGKLGLRRAVVAARRKR